MLTAVVGAASAAPDCTASSGERLLPVIELHTSEGCSSCPPADKWLSTLKGKPVVAQAFHVGYWDYIGWVDRFASPLFTDRQREMAALNRLQGVYTPQVLRNGRDWREWRDAARVLESNRLASAAITLRRVGENDSFEAQVTPTNTATSWTAYWTVTEHGHSSRVKSGENSGEFLKHDFVVRQYVPVGQYQGPQVLKFFSIPAQSEHPRQINLVVSDIGTRQPLQSISLQCS